MNNFFKAAALVTLMMAPTISRASINDFSGYIDLGMAIVNACEDDSNTQTVNTQGTCTYRNVVYDVNIQTTHRNTFTISVTSKDKKYKSKTQVKITDENREQALSDQIVNIFLGMDQKK